MITPCMKVWEMLSCETMANRDLLGAQKPAPRQDSRQAPRQAPRQARQQVLQWVSPKIAQQITNPAPPRDIPFLTCTGAMP